MLTDIKCLRLNLRDPQREVGEEYQDYQIFMPKLLQIDRYITFHKRSEAFDYSSQWQKKMLATTSIKLAMLILMLSEKIDTAYQLNDLDDEPFEQMAACVRIIGEFYTELPSSFTWSTFPYPRLSDLERAIDGLIRVIYHHIEYYQK